MSTTYTIRGTDKTYDDIAPIAADVGLWPVLDPKNDDNRQVYRDRAGHHVWAIRGPGGFSFEIYGGNQPVRDTLEALAERWDGWLLSEHDPEFWG